ncbi:3-oxoacyl-[acyl-carrier-protein] reductase [Oscillospiraceae bacterium MB08-C2-2]|nr:3-oxoacyl-[acyl-carrier-protein] reductase [Oscillospiraceae bacterium MB08-C2-2]
MNKTVLITGASQGIGAVLAKAFAAKGYNVAINCYNASTLENGGRQTQAACEELGAKAACFVADVSDFEQCATLVKEVTEAFGAVDVLVNNAGITRDGLLVQMTEQNFDDVIAANMKSVFNMTRHAAKGMIKRRGGSIINMASVAGVYGNPGQMNYSASKAGIIGMTKTTAKELGKRGITCNAIAPGLIESPMTDVLSDELKAKMLLAVSLGRFGKAEDVAQVALFLAEASYVTGQVLLVDGGLSM